MNPFEMIALINNPQQLAARLMNSQQVSNNPRARKAVQLIQNQDSEGLRSMAENLCKEYGTTPDKVMASLQNMKI